VCIKKITQALEFVPLLFSPLLPISALHHHLQGRIQRWAGRGSSPSTAAAIMEPLLIFIGMKEMEEDVKG
jgi:hypothetical protein